MEEFKQFKDPIYGYIQIPSYIVNEIIDTNVFQRLRRIIQTSYSPLYPSAIHNRFVHSIGVFHLGRIASDRLIMSIEANKEIDQNVDWKHLQKIFLLACLLHDVGHAPFSHTGEKFYLDNTTETKRYEKIHKDLYEIVGSETFGRDIPVEDSKSAAPHEIMSAIIGIESFASHFASDFDKELFARCITGYKFTEDFEVNSVYNCFISLLNSKVIDVDRLDYLIRDAYFTGFETINIDFNRLLTSITMVKKEVLIDGEEKEKYEVAYNKSAVSVIENVVYAHDSERKWIQTHPVVLYDMYIIQHILYGLEKTTSGEGVSLFSRQALSPLGIDLPNGQHISLLCDDDIVHLLKSKADDDLYAEFFARNKRRHPLWKSESEYKAYLSLPYGGIALNKLETALDLTEKYVRKYTDSWIINDDIIKKVEDEIKKIQESKDDGVDEKSKNKQLKSKNAMLSLMKCMKQYSEECDCLCSFVILKASQFYSGFNKNEFENISIVFPKKESDNFHKFKKVVSTLTSAEDNSKEFFYLYFNPNDCKNFNKEEFCKRLYTTFM